MSAIFNPYSLCLTFLFLYSRICALYFVFLCDYMYSFDVCIKYLRFWLQLAMTSCFTRYRISLLRKYLPPLLCDSKLERASWLPIYRSGHVPLMDIPIWLQYSPVRTTNSALMSILELLYNSESYGHGWLGIGL